MSNKAKITTFVLMGVGLLGLLIGYFTDHSEHVTQRFWSNLLINGYFFFGISLTAVFFLALQYVAEVGWSVVIKRIVEAVMSYLPIGALVLMLVFFASTMHWNHIYHWMDGSVTHEYVIEATMHGDHPEYVNEMVEGAVENHHFDQLIANKTAYLNAPFFWIRSIVYLLVWFLFARFFRKQSLKEDKLDAGDKEGSKKIHKKNIVISAIFIVFFAYTSSASAWDWLMSIDTHWFSTMYGWYAFSGMWISTMIVVSVLITYLKSRGNLKEVNDSHIHDVNKWMFAISMLWSYLWFSQFMLIWYSNIPEEVTYYMERFADYKLLYVGAFFVNFLFPFFILMSRDAKRNVVFFLPVALIIFIAHWIDVFVMVMPGTMHEHGNHIGLLEIGMFLLFLGVFIFTVLRALSKAPLMVKNHPMYDESVHLHH